MSDESESTRLTRPRKRPCTRWLCRVRSSPCTTAAQIGELAVRRLRIYAPLRHDVTLRWECIDEEVQLDGMNLSACLNGPNGAVDVPLTHFGRNRGRIAMVEFGADAGQSSPLTKVVVHWLNLPLLFPGASPSTPGRRWVGRWTGHCGPWQLRLDSRPDLSEVLRIAAEHEERFAMTHVGVITRSDGGSFDRATAAEVLDGWQLAMSFALGRWVAPALPVAFDATGTRLWEKWSPWRCDGIAGAPVAWWDTHTADDLGHFVDRFLQHWLDPARRIVVRHVAQHTIAANHSDTTVEGRILLAQAGLEYLGWVNLVLEGGMTKNGYKKLRASDVTRLLLDAAGVPTTIPTELGSIVQLLSAEVRNAPDALSWVRNRLTHPKDAEEPYRIEQLLWDTSQLLAEYLELLLLHRIGYDRRYQLRYPPGRWAHSTTRLVPWAVSPAS